MEQAQNLNRAYAEAQCRSGSPAPDPATPTYIPIKEISPGRGTGGVDEDGVLGDEGLMVDPPRDGDGAAVKVPAKVQIAAWEVTTAGLKNPIGTWGPASREGGRWRSWASSARVTSLRRRGKLCRVRRRCGSQCD
ncbi:MAG: hypothetical protein U0792_09515 [Gemmataceae bacterium]